MSTKIVTIVLLAAGAVVAAILLARSPLGGDGAAAPPDAIIARVGDRPLTVADLRYAYEHGEDVDPTVPAAELRGDLLDRLIRRILLAEDARQRGYERSGALAEYRRGVERALLAEELRRRIYEGKVDVTEDELRELYERYHYTFRVHHLNVDTRARAEDLHTRLLAGEDFESLTRRYSNDPGTRDQGGDLGEITAGYLIIEFEDAVFQLEPGEITEVIKGKGENYKIFRLDSMERDREPPASFEELRPTLEQRVRTRESGAALYAFQRATLEGAHYAIDEEGYQRFADILRDRIALWEATVAMSPDSLAEQWIFKGWEPEEQAIVIATYDGGNITAAEFNKNARNMKVCPTCLWRDSDVQLQQFIKGMVFDRLYEFKIRDLRQENVAWVAEELERKVDDRLVEMLITYLTVRPREVSDEDARRYFETHQELFRVSAEAKVQRIVVPTEKQAWDIMNRLEGGADFAAVARRFSIDQGSNFRGGETDFFRPGMMDGMADVAFAHEVGELVPPFQTELGWEVIRILEKRPERIAAFAEVAEAARTRAAQERTRERVDAHLEELERTTAIEIDADVLARVELEPLS